MNKVEVVYHDINTEIGLEDRIPYSPPVDPNNFGSYAIKFLLAGFIMMSFFVINYLSQKEEHKSIPKQLFYALLSSAFAAIGFCFAIMECGIFL